VVIFLQPQLLLRFFASFDVKAIECGKECKGLAQTFQIVLAKAKAKGLLDNEDPCYSEILFNSEMDRLNDGFLSVAEIYNLQLNAAKVFERDQRSSLPSPVFLVWLCGDGQYRSVAKEISDVDCLWRDCFSGGYYFSCPKEILIQGFKISCRNFDLQSYSSCSRSSSAAPRLKCC
jgi:hypothetical protein